MDVSENRGTPKWMVKIMENPIKMDDLGVPLFLETPKWFVKHFGIDKRERFTKASYATVQPLRVASQNVWWHDSYVNSFWPCNI